MRRLENRVWIGGLSLIFCCFFGVQNHVYCQTTIQDSNFAKAIREVCPMCIDTSNRLLPAAASLKALNVPNKNIRNLTGLEGFTGLEQLDCNSNQLTSLPELPNNLDWLLCYRNKIGRLPRLPESLRLLNCTNNELDMLPSLPSGLVRLLCSGNKLKALSDKLPITLEVIDFSHNQITQSPQLRHIPFLRFLYCSGNQLKQLPDLPLLFTLHCANNQLKSLPELPYTLRDLNCSNNQIVSLRNLPTRCIFLNLSSNELTCLPIIPSEYLLTIRIDADKITCFPNEVGTAQVLNKEGQSIAMPPLCQESLTHITGALAQGTYIATKSIESSAYLSEGTTEYHTSQSITLKPGFQAQTGTVFTAEIRGCN